MTKVTSFRVSSSLSIRAVPAGDVVPSRSTHAGLLKDLRV